MSRSIHKPALAALTGGLLLSASAFASTPLAQGYMLGADPAAAAQPQDTAKAPQATSGADKAKAAEGKCGEGKCGAGMSKPAAAKAGAPKAAEGKCGEGKCGAGKAKAAEGKCGGDKAKAAEGKCGGTA